MLEVRRLEELEGVIERGLATFIEVGNAIREIRDARLYKDQYKTFEEYCRERWGWSRNYANKQVVAAETAAAVGTIVPISNEAQAREIAPLVKEDPETARRLWGGLAEEHGDSLTAKHVKKAVEEVKEAKVLRAELPPQTRTVVENSDPEDCSLSRNPAQLRHLKAISEKRGDGQAAETAERVANGEFRSTFEAYPEVKADPEARRKREIIEREMEGVSFDLTDEEKAPLKIVRNLLTLEKLDFDRIAATQKTAEDAYSLGRDGARLIEVGKKLEAACERRGQELEPGVRRIK